MRAPTRTIQSFTERSPLGNAEAAVVDSTRVPSLLYSNTERRYIQRVSDWCRAGSNAQVSTAWAEESDGRSLGAAAGRRAGGSADGKCAGGLGAHCYADSRAEQFPKRFPESPHAAGLRELQ